MGALLVETEGASHCGVIFFNNVGTLGMCGHGLIGVVTALHYQGQLSEGRYCFDTPVGVVEVELQTAPGGCQVCFDNVPCRRYLSDVSLEVPQVGRVVGDIAWGGNWFFLVKEPSFTLQLQNVAQLTDCAWRIRRQLEAEGVAGDDGAVIDHVEFFSAAEPSVAESKNFVLCPGGAYDRSPCGTGTSAKLACLAADGKLQEGETWRQQGIVGSVFEGSVRAAPGYSIGEQVIPRICGEAHVIAQGELVLSPEDPFRWGFHAPAEEST